MATIKKTTTHEINVGKNTEKLEPFCAVGCGESTTVQPLWKTVWSFFKELKIEVPYDPAIPLLDTYPKGLKLESQ